MERLRAVEGDRHKLADRCQRGNERFSVFDRMESEALAPLTCSGSHQVRGGFRVHHVFPAVVEVTTGEQVGVLGM